MRVAVIGAGVSGIVSLKSCKEEGIDAVCYEMTSRIGGLWSPHEPKEGVSAAYAHLVTNTSKEMMIFSDFPMPASWPTYLTPVLVHRYIESYCENFDLMRDIKLEHRVVKLEKSTDHEMSGCWDITILDMSIADATPVTQRFDAVMLCSGVFAYPFTPQIPGTDEFKGKIIHAHFYTNHKDYSENDRVLVFGNKHSGCDVATDLCKRVSEPVYLSARSGVAVMRRDYANPFDMRLTFFSATLSYLFPSLYRSILRKIVTTDFDYETYIPGMKNQAAAVVLNDEMFSCLDQGMVKPVWDVTRFTESSVILSNGECIELDAVIMATGHEVKVPFVDPDVLDNDKWCNYKHVWPVHLTKNTLAVIGFIRILGPLPPVAELQARWAVQVFKRNCKLPSPEVMLSQTSTYTPGVGHSLRSHIQTSYAPYSQELAEQVGCLPTVGRFFCQPFRWVKVYFGTAFPYVFRLVGPGKCKAAWYYSQSAKSRIHFSNS